MLWCRTRNPPGPPSGFVQVAPNDNFANAVNLLMNKAPVLGSTESSTFEVRRGAGQIAGEAPPRVPPSPPPRPHAHSPQRAGQGVPRLPLRAAWCAAKAQCRVGIPAPCVLVPV
jgi:hypothetical protein